MKKFALVFAAVCAASGALAAQGRGAGASPGAATVLSGTLRFQGGTIALATESGVFYVPALERLVGFAEGLKEGSRVSLEGYVSGDYIAPLTVTVNGRTYGFAPRAAAAPGTAPGAVPGGAYGYGWCHGYGGGIRRGGRW